MKQTCDGLSVHGIDGRRIGTVSAVGDGCLWIETGRAEAVCISDAAILSVAGGGVSLVCLADGLGRYACVERRTVEEDVALQAGG